MEQLKEKLTLEKFDSIVSMLNSQDKENGIVALQCIENVDFKTNMAFILLVKKRANASSELWKEHAPQTYKNLVNIGVAPDKVSNYKTILETLVKNRVPKEDLDFYSVCFANYLKNTIKDMGYELVEEVKVNIALKNKDYESDTVGTVS